ncbi:TPA: hypothetical protein ACIBJQ_004525 [Salmonella enterica subsp. enterica serovar Java]
MHGFACKSPYFLSHATPVPARPEPVHAPALKATSLAGRRGGESIARNWLYLAPLRIEFIYSKYPP